MQNITAMLQARSDDNYTAPRTDFNALLAMSQKTSRAINRDRHFGNIIA
jgi:hypothetical protein